MSHSRPTRLAAGCAAALAVALLLTGCAASAPASPDASSTDGSVSGSLTVSFLAGTAFIDDAMTAFAKENPGVSFQDVQSTSNTYQPQIRAQLDAGQGPDVMFVWGGSGNAMATKTLAEAGKLADLSDAPWVDAIGEVANSFVSSDGAVHALNSYQNPTGFVYNVDLLDKLGLKIPTTFPALLTFCADAQAKGVVAIALGAQTGYLATAIPLQLANSLVYAKDPDFEKKIASGQEKWSTSKLWKDSLTTALTQYVKMQDAGCFPDNVTGYSDTAAKQLVASEQALGNYLISSGIPELVKMAPDTKFDLVTLPATDNAKDLVLTSNVGAAYAVSANSRNLPAARAFIDFMGRPDQLAAAAAANYGLPYTPADDTRIPEETAGIADIYRAGRVMFWQTNFWPGYEVKQTMIAESQNLLNGTQSIEGVVSAVNGVLGDS